MRKILSKLLLCHMKSEITITFEPKFLPPPASSLLSPSPSLIIFIYYCFHFFYSLAQLDLVWFTILLADFDRWNGLVPSICPEKPPANKRDHLMWLTTLFPPSWSCWKCSGTRRSVLCHWNARLMVELLFVQIWQKFLKRRH